MPRFITYALAFMLALTLAVLAIASPQDGAGAAGVPVQDESATSRLVREVELLLEEMDRLRAETAEAKLEAEHARRELEEMRQFIADHDRYGEDWQSYRGIKAIAEREARAQAAELRRQEYEARKAEQAARRRQARAANDARRAQMNKVNDFRRNGFTPLGLDIYHGKMTFFYKAVNDTIGDLEYAPGIGDVIEIDRGAHIDFTKMTISGSILNASEQTLNLGVAITFFNETGGQVGHEIVQINNARPNVPYPFTSKIDMTLDRPFATSSVYVLYADPIAGEDSGS